MSQSGFWTPSTAVMRRRVGSRPGYIILFFLPIISIAILMCSQVSPILYYSFIHIHKLCIPIIIIICEVDLLCTAKTRWLL